MNLTERIEALRKIPSVSGEFILAKLSEVCPGWRGEACGLIEHGERRVLRDLVHKLTEHCAPPPVDEFAVGQRWAAKRKGSKRVIEVVDVGPNVIRVKTIVDESGVPTGRNRHTTKILRHRFRFDFTTV